MLSRREEYTVWALDMRAADAASLAAARGWLAPDSLRRADGALRPHARDRTILSRAALRHAVMLHAGIPRSGVRLEECAGRAPRVVAPARPAIQVSLSHSSHWIACAVSSAGAVAVDVEDTSRNRDIRALARWMLSAPEHEWFARQPDAADAFYRLWSGKEAAFKLASSLDIDAAVLGMRFTPRGNELAPPSPATRMLYARLAPHLACTVAAIDGPPLPRLPEGVRWIDPKVFAQA